MDFIRRFIEQKISNATGAEVRIGKFSFSPLSGVVEVRDLVVGTILTVKRIEAKIAVARALKQEIVVRSLVIEGPVVTINRTADGKLNLPLAPSRQTTASTPAEKNSWEFEANKALLVGGRVEMRDAGGYRASLENLTGSVAMKSPHEAEFVFAAESLGRRDKLVELGAARLLGKLSGGLNFSLSAGSILDLVVRSPAPASGPWDGEINLAMALSTLLALLPPAVRSPIATASGEARLMASGSFDRDARSISLQSFELRTGPVTVAVTLAVTP